MKRTIQILSVGIPPLLLLSSCALFRDSRTADAISPTGPTVVEIQTEPGTFELNEEWRPRTESKVIAQVMDITSEIEEVRLRFSQVPMHIPMEHAGGSTWQATLTPEQLRALAVAGETMRYEASVIARNEDGLITVGPDPIEIRIKAPMMDSPEVAGEVEQD